MKKGKVHSLSISNQHTFSKKIINQVEVIEGIGIKGDAHAGSELGENITTVGIALLDLPKNTLLKIGKQVSIQITGLRNPCHQIDKFQKGLLKEVVGKDESGAIVRRAGIMGIVLKGGIINSQDEIEITYPALPHHKLERV